MKQGVKDTEEHNLVPSGSRELSCDRDGWKEEGHCIEYIIIYDNCMVCGHPSWEGLVPPGVFRHRRLCGDRREGTRGDSMVDSVEVRSVVDLDARLVSVGIGQAS